MKYLLLLLLSVFATSVAALTVPFANVVVQPNQVIQAPYTFGQFSVLFCWEPSLQSVGNFTWPYKGRANNTSIPVNLTISSQYTGFLADTSGVITFQNTTNAALVVSCEYAF